MGLVNAAGACAAGLRILVKTALSGSKSLEMEK